jgi:hypothetical protein
MMDRRSTCRQLDLPVRAANGPEQGLPLPIRAEVILLLKLLIAERAGSGAVQSIESAANE